MSRIVVAGAGAWGQALAHVARTAGHDVRIWSRGQAVPQDYEAVILAVPAQGMREVVTRFDVPAHCPLIISAKGIERGSLQFMNEVVEEVAPLARIMVLSGPSFAADVMRQLPTAVTLAAPGMAEAQHWSKALSLPHFRIYAADDVKGVELGGALKNVLAIACGIADGKKLGDSARAALTTRGFAELMRLGKKLGARPETLTGLSGLGDLLLTCASAQSRNYSFGRAIGEGCDVAEATQRVKGVVEGAFTAQAACRLAQSHGVEMPIVAAVAAIVEQGADPAQEMQRLLMRPLKQEVD